MGVRVSQMTLNLSRLPGCVHVFGAGIPQGFPPTGCTPVVEKRKDPALLLAFTWSRVRRVNKVSTAL